MKYSYRWEGSMDRTLTYQYPSSLRGIITSGLRLSR
jgi:hypothetical protein